MGVMCISQIAKINPESYFVDTNIWINCFFHPMKQPIRQTIDKSKKYLNFFEKITNDGGKIFTSSLCYSELFSAIEKFYWRNFKIGLSETLKSNSLLDAHDAVYLKIMSMNNIKNIITEDSDFNEIKNIDVYHV